MYMHATMHMVLSTAAYDTIVTSNRSIPMVKRLMFSAIKNDTKKNGRVLGSKISATPT